jgi:cation diffusion facilitator family transporter
VSSREQRRYHVDADADAGGGATPEARRPRELSGSGAKSSIVAFLANLGIAIAKFLAWAVTGSAALLAEALHSVADTGNQGLLILGRHRAKRDPTRHHPFGFGRERYFWSFVVAVVLFSGGGLFALVEGEERLRRPHGLSSYEWSVVVLFIGICLEGFSLRTAIHEARHRRSADESWWRFIRRTTVPELAVIILEDFGALCGLIIALIGTTLAEMTGNTRFDAMGSIGIGVLLTAIAATLAVEMKSLLIGEAASPRDIEQICNAIDEAATARHEVRVVDLRTELVGPDRILVVGTVEVPPSTAEVAAIIERIERRIRERVPAVRFVYLEPVTASPTRPRHASAHDHRSASPFTLDR